MKNVFSKIKLFFLMAFASSASFLSKVLWNDFSDWDNHFESLYWVEGPVTRIQFPESEPEPSLLYTICSFFVKWIEIMLIWIVFIVWIISYFKIRKVEDKDLKSKKIKKVSIIIWILLLIALLAYLSKYFYYFNRV